MDTKQKLAQQPFHSASSLPIFSPAVPSDSMKHISFTNAIMNIGQLDNTQILLQEQALEKDDLSPKLISGKWKSEKPEHENQFRFVEYRNQQKIISQLPSFDSLPVKTKCQISSNEQVLDVPELTAESMVQSQEFDVDNESNNNDLPISSISRYKIERVFNEQSEGSDDIPQNESKRKFYHPKEDYAESKCSQQSQSDDILTICRNCFCNIQKSKIIEAQNCELLKQVKFLQDELVKQQEKFKVQIQQIREDSQAKKADLTLPPQQMKQYFISQVEELNRSLTKVNELVKSYAIDFRGKETQVLEKLIIGIKTIEKEVLCLEKKQERRCQVQQIHNNYKKLISKLIKDVQERELKKDQEFKRFVQAVTDKRIEFTKQSQQTVKSIRSRRKSKTYTQKDEILDEQLIQQQKVQQQKKQRVQWLQLNYEKQKQKIRQFEKCQKDLARKYSQQFSDLLKEKAAYQNLLQKYTDQFSVFMKKIAKDQTNANIESQFFKNLSQRIFEISNSIPFQENDEQNLFAPENSEQLFDMIERIRRFYLKIQKYNKNREEYYQSQKSSFLLLFKDLVEYRKIDDCFILQVLQHKKYSRLSDLKELIHSTREKRKQLIDTNSQRQQKNVLKMHRTESFTINQLENTDDY